MFPCYRVCYLFLPEQNLCLFYFATKRSSRYIKLLVRSPGRRSSQSHQGKVLPIHARPQLHVCANWGKMCRCRKVGDVGEERKALFPSQWIQTLSDKVLNLLNHAPSTSWEGTWIHRAFVMHDLYTNTLPWSSIHMIHMCCTRLDGLPVVTSWNGDQLTYGSITLWFISPPQKKMWAAVCSS